MMMHEEPSIWKVWYMGLKKRPFKVEIMYVKANTEVDARAEVVYYFARRYPRRKFDATKDLNVMLWVNWHDIINPLPPMSRKLYKKIRVK